MAEYADYNVVYPALKDFEVRIRSVVDRAWQEWLASPFRSRCIYTRTRSNIVFDSIARLAMDEFGSDEAVHLIAQPAL